MRAVVRIDNFVKNRGLWGGLQVKDTAQLHVALLLHCQRVKQSFCYLMDHRACSLLTELHQAILYDIVDEQVYVSRDALFVGKLLHGLLNQVGLRVDEVSNVVYDLWIEQILEMLLLIGWIRTGRGLLHLRHVFDLTPF